MKFRNLFIFMIALLIAGVSNGQNQAQQSIDPNQFTTQTEKQTKFYENGETYDFKLTREYYLQNYGKDNPLNIAIPQYDAGTFPVIQAWNSVTDADGNSILGLNHSNFNVTENGLQASFTVQQIGGTQSALSVCLVIDKSGSMGSSGMAAAKAAALQFVNNMSNTDRASIVAYNASVYTVQPMTSNKTLLISAINSLYQGGSTAMYDGFYTGIQQCAPETGTIAVIGFTDGKENASSHVQSQVINYANQIGCPLYTIGIGSAQPLPLQQMANATGGSYYYAPNPSQIGQIYDAISQSIQEQYKIVFNSPNPQLDGTSRTVQITVDYTGNNASASFTYIAPLDNPNAPIIQLTANTVNLINNDQVEGMPLNISAIITDNQAVATTKLFYKNTITGFYNDVNLVNSGGNIYEYSIPGNEVVDGSVNFYFTASDNEGNSVSLPAFQPFDYPYSINVLPNEAPEITHIAIDEAPVGKTIDIDAGISDNTGSIASVKLYYKNHDVPIYTNLIEMQLNSKGAYSAEISEVTDAQYDLTNATDGKNGIDYMIKAEDEFGSISYFPNDFGSNSIPKNIEVIYLLSNQVKDFNVLQDSWYFRNFEKAYSNGSNYYYGLSYRDLPLPLNGMSYKDEEPVMWPEYYYNQNNYSWVFLPPYSLKKIPKKAWPSWEMMVDAFGPDNCYIVDVSGFKIKKPSIVFLWKSILNLQTYLGLDTHGFKGACFGFANTSSMVFNGNDVPYIEENFQHLNELDINDNTRRSINSVWTKQFGATTTALYASAKPLPTETLEDFKEAFLNKKSKVLMLWKYNTKTSFHAVTPYKIDKDKTDPSVENIYFYDNTYQSLSVESQNISINTSNNILSGWSFNDFNSEHFPTTPPDYMKIFALPEPSIYSTYQEPIINLPVKTNDEVILFTGVASSYNIQSVNGSIAFSLVDSTYVNNYPGSSELIAATSEFAPPIGFILPKENFTYSLENQSDSMQGQILLKDMDQLYYYRYENTSSHNMSFKYDTLIKILNGNNFDKQINIGAINQGFDTKGEIERVFSLSNLTLCQDDSISYYGLNEGFFVRNYQSSKDQLSYDVDISLVNSDGLKVFSHGGIEIQSNTTHFISPNWNNILGQLTIFVDLESNGEINDTLFLGNQQSSGHLIDLKKGWSLISTYQNLDTPQLETLFSDQIANATLEIMLGKSGIFWPAYNINLIGDWNPYEGYKIKMNLNDQVIISGEIVEDKSVSLSQGVSYLPVLSSSPVPSADIFGQIDSELLFAFDIVNSLVYWPEGGIYTLETLEPGKGYLVGMLAAGTVSFPETKGLNNYDKPQKQIVENAPWTVDNTGIAHIVSVYNSALADLQNGDIVAVFNSEEVCVGMAQYGGKAENLALLAYGDDFTTEAIDGMIEDELMYFAVYRPSTNETIQVQPSWDVSMTHSGIFAENGLSAITSLKLGALGLDDETLKAISIYPNPSSGLFNLHGIESAVHFTVLNSTGQEIQKFQTSTSTQIDLSKVSKGIYFVKMISENAVRVEKIIVE